MLIVTVAGLLTWLIARRVHWKWSLVAFFLVSLMVSMIVVDDVRTAGGVRDDIGPDYDRIYSIVYYNSTALFPFVMQKHHNWTARTFVYNVRFLNHDGIIVSQTKPADDQSEFMHLTLFGISVSLCFLGFVVAMLPILSVEFAIWWRKRKKYWYPE